MRILLPSSSPPDLRAFLQKYGEGDISDDILHAMITEADENKDGKVCRAQHMIGFFMVSRETNQKPFPNFRLALMSLCVNWLSHCEENRKHKEEKKVYWKLSTKRSFFFKKKT